MKNAMLTVMAVVGMAQAALAQDMPVEVRITGDRSVGSIITVDIYIAAGDRQIIATDTMMFFDTAILEPVGEYPWTTGDIWPVTDALWVLGNEVRDGNCAWYTCLDLYGPWLRGPGISSSMQFRVIGTGTCTFTFLEFYPVFIDEMNELIPMAITVDTFTNVAEPVMHSVNAVPQAEIGQIVSLTATAGCAWAAFAGEIEFEIDGTVVGTAPITIPADGSATTSVLWNTAGTTLGSHVITARLKGTIPTVASNITIIPVAASVVVVDESGGGAGAGGCSAGDGRGNVLAALLALAIILVARQRSSSAA